MILYFILYSIVIALGVLVVSVAIIAFTAILGAMVLWVLAIPYRLWRALRS